MMNRSLNLIPPPANPKETGTSKSWEKIESRLGLQLPADYKEFIDHYGTGSIDDFIIVYNPFAQDEYYNLFFALDTLHEADQQAQMMGNPVWTAVDPFVLYSGNEGLLPWGCTINMKDAFFWKVKGAPETWETIFYNLRNGEYEVWKYPVTGFLYRLFSRQIESVLLPEDFPVASRRIRFIPV